MPGERDTRLDPKPYDLLAPTAGGDHIDLPVPQAWPAPQTAEHGSRGKHVLIGVAVGAAVGAATALAFPAKCSNTTSEAPPCALGAPVILAFHVSLGILAGGLIGAVLPSGP